MLHLGYFTGIFTDNQLLKRTKTIDKTTIKHIHSQGYNENKVVDGKIRQNIVNETYSNISSGL